MFFSRKRPRIAINGLGRIGRTVLKLALDQNLDIVAINNRSDITSISYLLKYDSIYGPYNKTIETGKDFIKIEGKKIKVFQEEDPEKLPWQELKIDIVIEATGCFRDKKGSKKHITAGAKKVVITAPCERPDRTIVLGVNEKQLKNEDSIISIASCTTNCLAPVVKVLNDKFGIKKGFMTTIHAYTTSQNLLDGSSRKLRRGRAAPTNIVPTTSGATTAVTNVIPELKGKLNGLALRVPVPTGSIVDLVIELKKQTTVNEINKTFKKISNGKLKNIIRYTDDEIVSSDIIRDPNSAIIDGSSTQVIKNTVKILAWYDNEYGYSNRIIDVIKLLKF